METLAITTDNWLTRVIQWQTNEDALSVTLEQTSLLQDISDYLIELRETLRSYSSITVALQSLPTVGQLLGRLTLFPRLLLDCDLFKALMNCILFFYVDSPTCSVEHRSKKWVMSQVQQMVSRLDDALSSNILLNIGGKKLGDFHAACAQKICEGMFTDNVRHDLHVCSYDTPILCDICHVCLSLRHITVFDYILTSSMKQLITTRAASEHTKKLIQEIEITQQHPYTADHPVIPLSYRLQVLVWSYSQCSLEHEVLDLVEKALQSPLFHKDNRIVYRHVIQACANEPHVYCAVFSMLRELIMKTNGHWSLITLTYVLHAAVRKAINTNPKDSFHIAGHYVLSLQPLSNLLSVRPKDLPLSGVEHHIQLIDKCLNKLLQETRLNIQTDLFYIMVHHLDWYLAALCHTFTCDKKVLPCFLRLISQLQKPGQDVKTNELIEDVMDSLRCLYRKQNLTSIDLECALAPFLPVVTSETKCEKLSGNVLLCRLLLLFCLLSAGGHKVLQNVLQMICGNSLHDQVETLLDTVSHIQNAELTTFLITKNTTEQIISMANQCSRSTFQTPGAKNIQNHIALLFK